jgi:PhnB protein
MAVKPIPEGYHSVTPYLIIKGAAKALEFYKKAFGARELMRVPGPQGTIGHAEIQIGDSRIMLADECPGGEFLSPTSRGGTSVSLLIYCEDVDNRFNQALAAGARVIRPLQDQFYGDRSGAVEDPFGHQWSISTHVEDVSMEEIQRRMDAMSKQAG